MKSPNSRKVSRALRHTQKSKRSHASPAKSAQIEGGRATASGVITQPDPALCAAIGVSLITSENPEFVPMGAQKAIVTSSMGLTIFSNMAALQRTWINFGFVQARLATALMGAPFLPRGGPQQRRL